MLSTRIQYNRRIPVKVDGTQDPYSDKVTFEISLFTSFFSSSAAKGDIKMAVKPVNDESQQAEDYESMPITPTHTVHHALEINFGTTSGPLAPDTEMIPAPDFLDITSGYMVVGSEPAPGNIPIPAPSVQAAGRQLFD
jgi:hypothetical protein